MRRRQSVAAVLVLSVVGAGVTSACGGSDSSSSCVRGEGAEVCFEIDGGAVEVRATGLEPGTELSIDVARTGVSIYEIDSSGGPRGKIGILRSSAGPFDASVSAVAAGGQRFSGEITVEG